MLSTTFSQLRGSSWHLPILAESKKWGVPTCSGRPMRYFSSSVCLPRSHLLRPLRIKHSEFAVPPFAKPHASLAIEANKSRVGAMSRDRIFHELLGFGIEPSDVVPAEVAVPDVAGFPVLHQAVRPGHGGRGLIHGEGFRLRVQLAKLIPHEVAEPDVVLVVDNDSVHVGRLGRLEFHGFSGLWVQTRDGSQHRFGEPNISLGIHV